MKQTTCLWGIIFLLTVVAGCTSTRIIESGTQPPNKITMELVGTGEQLLKQNRIDLHRVFVMADKTDIDVWVINPKGKGTAKPRGTVILLHGEGQSKANYIGIGTNLAKMGFDVVLIDLRCHGRSGGKYITCGAKEKQDVKTVVDTLIAEKKIISEPLYVFGVTFGGATGIQYAAIEPNVRGVVAIAPWKDTVSKARRDVGLLMNKEDFEKVLDEIAQAADFNPRTTSAVIDAANLNCPVYLIHGMLDLAVPVADSEAILEALPGPKKLKIIMPGPEQLAVGIGWETWVPKQIEKVVKGKIQKSPPSESNQNSPTKTEVKAKPLSEPEKEKKE